ncbi:hypothetical protein JCM9279_006351 [Rhodotorula babjevae]
MAPPAPAKKAAAAAPVAPAAPVVPKLSATVDAGFDVRIVADLELKLADPKLKVELALDKVPLPGRWSVEIYWRDASLIIDVDHGELPPGAHGSATTAAIVFRCKHEGDYLEVDSVDWHEHVCPRPSEDDPTSSFTGYRLVISPATLADAQSEYKGSFDPAQQCEYRLTFDMHSARRRPPRSTCALAERVHDMATKPLPHDVRLFFPGNHGRPDAELWTTERFLTASSTYFWFLLRSGDAETVTIGVKRARTRSSTVEQAAASRRLLYKAPASKELAEDSDREVDVLTFQGKIGEAPPALHDPLEDGEFPYKQVTIEQACYTTYRAVLLWLSTGYIQLTSAFAAAPNPHEARTASLLAFVEENGLPAPVSPKSVYRLASIVGLAELKSIAMRYVRDEALTVSTAPAELFSELARDYVEWRTMVLDWIMERWEEVEVSDGWTAMMQKVGKGEVDGAAPIVVEVLGRVAKRKGAKS